MNKKLLLSLILWVMAAFVPAMAQNTLTVYEGENFNGYVPVEGYWADSYLKSEFVIPAADLAAMNGCTITELTWYLSTKPTKSWAGNYQIFMKEVEETTLSDFTGSEDASIVYEGVLDASGENFVIEFGTPYVYNGGNLLIGVYNTVRGAYSSCSFYGLTVEGASVQGHSSTSLDVISATQRNFIPKTTFAYSPAGTPIYVKPKNLAVSNIGPNEATLTWEAGSTETAWNVEYKKASEAAWTSAGKATTTTLVLEDLANGIDYEVRINSDYGDGVSNWVNASFTTPLCAAEDMGEISYTLGDHYADSWNGAYINVISVTTGNVVGTITQPTGSTTVTGTFPLCYGETYNFVWVSGNYDHECSFTITDPSGNILAEHAEDEAFTDYNLFTYTMSMGEEPGIEELYLVGTFNDWSQEEGLEAFTLNENNEFEASLALEAGAEFKLITPVTVDATTAPTWKWFGGVDDNNVGYFLINEGLLGVGINMVTPGANFKVEEADTYDFVVTTARGINEPLSITVNKALPTAITDLNSENGDNTWYNIQGMKLQGVPTVPGIYIQNGKKVVVK